MADQGGETYAQPPLFEWPGPPAPGWRPFAPSSKASGQGLGSGAQVYWAAPAEMTARLDAAYYVVACRQDRLLRALRCPQSPLSDWAEVNPPARRLPSERGYVLYERCRYVRVLDIREGCWLVGPYLGTRAVRELPERTVYQPQPGDLLLPLGHASLHKAVRVVQVDLPLVATSPFALLAPRSPAHGLALLALLHHRVLGEQLWALTSGTRARAVSASKLPALQVPQIVPGLCAALAARVESLLHAQAMCHYPGLELPIVEYWQDGPLSQWQSKAQALAAEVMTMIDRALEA